jgi:dTDP-4-dehydrorhamnose reductase
VYVNERNVIDFIASAIATIHWTARRPFDSSLNVAKAQEIFNNKLTALDEGLRVLSRKNLLL